MRWRDSITAGCRGRRRPRSGAVCGSCVLRLPPGNHDDGVQGFAIVNPRCIVLVLVLALVLVGFGMLKVASITGTLGWAWVSVAMSALAGILLVVDWRRKLLAMREEDMTGLPLPGASQPIEAPTVAFPPAAARPEPVTEAIQPLSRTTSRWAPQETQLAGRDDRTPGGPPPGWPPLVPDARAGSDGSDTAVGDAAAGSRAPEGCSGSGDPADGWQPSMAGGEREPGADAAGPLFAPAPTQAGQTSPESSSEQSPRTAASAAGDTTQAIRPVQPAPEPGQEGADSAAAAIVANLEDEVLVVDEQPRYHLLGCRSLVGRETIALQAKEAVDLGFTPCSVCTPVRVLVSVASRYGKPPGAAV